MKQQEKQIVDCFFVSEIQIKILIKTCPAKNHKDVRTTNTKITPTPTSVHDFYFIFMTPVPLALAFLHTWHIWINWLV